MKLKVSLQKTILKKSVKNYFITASTVESLKKNKFVTGKQGSVYFVQTFMISLNVNAMHASGNSPYF